MQLGFGKQTLVGIGAGDGERVPFYSPDCLKVLLPLEVAAGRVKLLPPHGVCGNLQLQEPSRSKVYSQAAGGCPAHGNKRELMLSCSTQVLLSTADLRAAAHLGSLGGAGVGDCVTPAHLIASETWLLLWWGLPLGQGNQRRATGYSALFPSLPLTHSVVSGQPLALSVPSLCLQDADY